jgi:hypothetical protein
LSDEVSNHQEKKESDNEFDKEVELARLQSLLSRQDAIWGALWAVVGILGAFAIFNITQGNIALSIVALLGGCLIVYRQMPKARRRYRTLLSNFDLIAKHEKPHYD